jgi:hypothetical protein
MPQSTTVVSACNAVIRIDGAAGTLVDVSGSTNQVDVTFTLNIGEAHTFDGDYPIRKVCGKDASATITALYSVTADEAVEIFGTWYHTNDGAARTVEINVPDSANTSDRYSGEWILSEYNFTLSSSDAGPIMVNATLMPDGAIAKTTITT